MRRRSVIFHSFTCVVAVLLSFPLLIHLGSWSILLLHPKALLNEDLDVQIPDVYDMLNASTKYCNGASALVMGPDDGDHVILMHGFPDTGAWTWSLLVAPLVVAGFHITVPVLRGYELRTAGSDTSLTSLVDDLTASS